MKRKTSRPTNSQEFVWFWDKPKKRRSLGAGSGSRGFAKGPDFEDDDDDIQLLDARGKKPNHSVQLELLLKPAPVYRCYLPLPYELLVKIFRDVVKLSDDPIKDLYSISRVCEDFRQIVISNLDSLWFRLDLSLIPMTDNNIRTINRIIFPNDVIASPLRELVINGQAAASARDLAHVFMERALLSPKLEKFALKNISTKTKQSTKLTGTITRSLKDCRNLNSLTITDAKPLFGNQKWISDFLTHGHGKKLETLDLSLSMTFIGPVLQRSICNLDNCPNLKVLDLTTCDCILTNSFDICQLAVNAPNLEVFRAGNVSFKRVSTPPVEYHFTKLRELSIPIAIRDADRDDPLYASIAYGSNSIRLLDIRGSIISAHAIIDTPSFKMEELHMDDICPITRRLYGKIISRWRKTLEILSLVKINCSQTINDCLENLLFDEDEDEPTILYYKGKYNNNNTHSRPAKKISRLKELDLSSSDIEAEMLHTFLLAAKDLESINLTSCRSLPRGCKGLYKRNPDSDGCQKLSTLIKKLGVDQPRKLR